MAALFEIQNHHLSNESISIKALTVCRWFIEQRSFWFLVSFRLRYRVLQTCSVAEASPKNEKSLLHTATSFLSML
jgi:hypothetical protein